MVCCTWAAGADAAQLGDGLLHRHRKAIDRSGIHASIPEHVLQFRESRTQTRLYVCPFLRSSSRHPQRNRPLHPECDLTSGGSDDLPRLHPCKVPVLVAILNSKRPNENTSAEV